MAASNQNSQYGQVAGTAAGAAVGSIVPGVGTMIGAGVGGMLGGTVGGMFGGESGPDYSRVTGLFNERKASIQSFAKSLATARAKYLTSLNNMYNNAHARFAGNSEAGFAARGLGVNGGAFASALAKNVSDYQFEGDLAAAGMERDDLSKIDAAEGGNYSGYMSAISGGPGLQYGQENRQSEQMGGFAMSLLNRGLTSKYGSPDNPMNEKAPAAYTHRGTAW